MGKCKKAPALKGFEEVLATLPEYDGFRKHPIYRTLLSQEGSLADYLKFLFVSLKRYGTASPAEKPLFNQLLHPAFLKNARSLDMDYQNILQDEYSGLDDSLHLTSYVCGVYQKLLRDGYGTPEQRVEIRQRYELLLSFLCRDTSQRAFVEHFIANSVNQQEITKDTVGEFDENATPSDIYNHLTFALRNNLSHIAHEIIGGLRYMKKEFPKGDPEFWYALVYLKDNAPEMLQRAISYMEKVPSTNRNYQAVQSMKAEAHARLGNIEYFEQEAMAEGSSISCLSMRSYLQILINNVDLESVEDSRLASLFQHFYKTYNTGPELESHSNLSDPNCTPMQLCKENVLKAVKEIYGFNMQVVHVTQISTDDWEIPSSVRRAQLILQFSARNVWDELMALLKDNTGDLRYDFVKKWFNVYVDANGNVSSRQMNTLLESSRTIAYDEDFVTAFIADLPYAKKATGLDLEYWLAEACRAAAACNHPDADFLWAELTKLCPDSENIYSQDRVYQKIFGYLRSHERLLYAAAESSYRKAKAESNEQGWKDCGMLSLSFFRVLEVELRDRIFVKAFRSPENQAVIKEFYNKLKPCVLAYENKVQAGERATDERNVIRARCGGGSSPFEFPQTVRGLMAPENMELGPMWYALRFLTEKCRVAEEWQSYQQALRQMVYGVLSEDGIAAIQDGTIERAISIQLLEAYRNPPAHARYLPFSKACECRDHVNQTLLQLHTQWLKKEDI